VVFRDHEVERGILKPVVEGQTVLGELVALSPDRDHAPYFLVDTVAEAPVKLHEGPEMVTSNSYREGWDRIFGKVNPEEVN
jgi:hypothetical protein